MRVTDDTAADLDRVRATVDERIRGADDPALDRRVEGQLHRLHQLFRELYGERDDALDVLAAVVADAAVSWIDRPDELKRLDEVREADPAWFTSNRMLGGVCYVDRYAGSLAGLRGQLPYVEELGLRYLHLMPLFEAPEGESDGGYAISSYRRVDPRLGTIDELREVAAELRRRGISLCLDFVFNHTSDEHEWARKAVAGEGGYPDYYFLFPDRELPDAYERTVREIFPDDHPGSFVQIEDGRWVWSTFHRYQWDLDYGNPAVFRAMAGEMMFLANLGVEVLRMDAVAFIWKRMGTACESLPEAHLVLQAFNAIMAIAAPGMVFKSEAIVHPDEVMAYISPGECRLSYNPLQMALSWDALATRDPRLLAQALERRHALPGGTAWVEYVRGHDDIGWTFADEDAAELGIDASAHRRFLNEFYTGRYPGSFARGVAFQENPRTGDARIAGTTASLAGVEAGEAAGLERALLLHAIALSTGGLPLLFLGDEVAQLNDYDYLDDPVLAGDSRWVNRPRRPVRRYAERNDDATVAGWMFQRMRRLIQVRQSTPEFAGNGLMSFDPNSPHVLAYQRPGDDARVLVLANFGDGPADITALTLSGFEPDAEDLTTGARIALGAGLRLRPWGFAWLRVRPVAAART